MKPISSHSTSSSFATHNPKPRPGVPVRKFSSPKENVSKILTPESHNLESLAIKSPAPKAEVNDTAAPMAIRMHYRAIAAWKRRNEKNAEIASRITHSFFDTYNQYSSSGKLDDHSQSKTNPIESPASSDSFSPSREIQSELQQAADNVSLPETTASFGQPSNVTPIKGAHLSVRG